MPAVRKIPRLFAVDSASPSWRPPSPRSIKRSRPSSTTRASPARRPPGWPAGDGSPGRAAASRAAEGVQQGLDARLRRRAARHHYCGGAGSSSGSADHRRATRPSGWQDQPGVLWRGLRRGPDHERDQGQGRPSPPRIHRRRDTGAWTRFDRPQDRPEDPPVDPARTDRVYVDVVSYNSKVYYVQGEVGSPGRLPITGNETVLDAINFAGGLVPTAAKDRIRLVRPSQDATKRASRPSRSTSPRSSTRGSRRPITNSSPATA